MKCQFHYDIIKFVKDFLYHLEYYDIYTFRLYTQVGVWSISFIMTSSWWKTFCAIWNIMIFIHSDRLLLMWYYMMTFCWLNRQVAVWSVRNIHSAILFLHDIFKLFITVMTYCWLRMCCLPFVHLHAWCDEFSEKSLQRKEKPFTVKLNAMNKSMKEDLRWTQC